MARRLWSKALGRQQWQRQKQVQRRLPRSATEDSPDREVQSIEIKSGIRWRTQERQKGEEKKKQSAAGGGGGKPKKPKKPK